MIVLHLIVVALPKWLQSVIRTVILNTHKINICWKMKHSCEKFMSWDSKFLHCGRKKQSRCRRRRRKTVPARKENARPPIHQACDVKNDSIALLESESEKNLTPGVLQFLDFCQDIFWRTLDGQSWALKSK